MVFNGDRPYTIPIYTVLPYYVIETLVGHVMCLKGLIAAAFESSEPLLLLRLNRRVGAIPTYRVYRLSDIDNLHRLLKPM